MGVTAEITQRILHDAGNGHWEMRIDRVGFEPVRECAENELVQDAAFVDTLVIAAFREAPVGEVLRVIIDLRPVSPCPQKEITNPKNLQCRTDPHEQAQPRQTI